MVVYKLRYVFKKTQCNVVKLSVMNQEKSNEISIKKITTLTQTYTLADHMYKDFYPLTGYKIKSAKKQKQLSSPQY